MNGRELNDLARLGLNVENGSYKKAAYFIAEYSAKDIDLLIQNGFQIEVLIDDMTKYYKERNKNSKPETKTKSSSEYSVPSHFKLGSMGGFLTHDEMIQELDSMRILYPNLISVKQVVSNIPTYENRYIYYVKISDNPDVDEQESEVLYTALHHAREPAAMQQMIYYMYYLLENYSTNDEIKYLVDNLEMYFVPCVNPDGYIYNETTEPEGGGMHRKNLNPNGTSNPGVDLNRNYGYEWGYDNTGSSNDPSQDTYRGTSGFSESETQAMKSFCENHSFKLGINFHCYSNLLIYPWGYIPDYETPDSLLFRKYSQLMTASNNYLYGTPSQTVNYSANGGSDDWMYGEQTTKPKIISFTPEAGNVNDGFWPEINRIEDICRVNMDMNFYIARFALKYAEVSEISSDFIPGLNGNLKLQIQCLGLDVPADFTVSVTPLSLEIISVGNAISFIGMQTLEENSDSINFTLDSTVQTGQIIKFLITVDNGMYQHSDTISKIFGQAQLAFIDSGNTISNWTSSGWNTTSSTYHSPSDCITDSPDGEYSISPVNSSITLTQSIDLSEASHAYLSFWAKWDINPAQDYVQLKLSTNNGVSWIPVNTTNTQASIVTNIAGQPVFTGYNGQWHQETADLSACVGQNIKFMFTLKSGWNYMYSYDGFYFDDFSVSLMQTGTSGIIKTSDDYFADVAYPNPAKSFVIIPVPENISFPCKLLLHNSAGQLMSEIILNKPESEIFFSVRNLGSGIYSYRFSDNYKSSNPRKLIIIK